MQKEVHIFVDITEYFLLICYDSRVIHYFIILVLNSLELWFIVDRKNPNVKSKTSRISFGSTMDAAIQNIHIILAQLYARLENFRGSEDDHDLWLNLLK